MNDFPDVKLKFIPQVPGATGPQGPQGIPGAPGLDGAIGTVRYNVPQSLTPAEKATAQINIGVHEVLSVSRVYYVRTDGNDANNGLANNAGGAFLTLQKAIDTVVNTLEIPSILAVTIQVGPGTYTAGAIINPWMGTGGLTIIGDTTTPSNVVISPTSANCFEAISPMTGSLIITGFELRTTTSGSGIYATYGAKVSILKLKFGQIASGFIAADFGAQINCLSTTLEIAGTNPTAGLHANLYGRIYIFDTVITFDAGVTLPYFAGCAEFGAIMLFSVTYSGTFTGAKYLVHNGGILETDATLPGSLAGTVENFSGGYYIQSGASVAPPPTAFTAIPTSAGGAFTSATGSGHWKNTGTGYVAFDYTMTITTVGPANTFTSVTLPFITARDTCIPFRLSLVSFVGFIQAGSNQMYLTKFDGSFGLVNGSVVVGGGVVEVL